MTIGIDKIAFATGQYVLKMDDLADARKEDPEKFSKGLMLDALSITPPTEDIITLGASAAEKILNDEDKEKIDMVILATESSIDQSKAGAVYLHSLLGIQPFARSIEMKEACYSATAALNYAKLHVEKHPESRVLVVASDIAKYGIKSSGESTQGSGAVAMLITSNPSILILTDDNLAQTRDVMDFWRPNYSTTPFVNGMYSTKQYLDSLKTTWREYQKQTGFKISDFAAFCFHIPFPKLAFKGLKKLISETVSASHKEQLLKHFQDSIIYSRQIGNIYTGSLYLGLLSMLENSQTLRAGDTIGFFSYGSGAVCEIFSARLAEGFQKQIQTSHIKELDNRIQLTVFDYEKLFFEEIELDAKGNAYLDFYRTGPFYLSGIKNHQRIYKRVKDK
ncbi:hydroxymethylglutaryl-CoA synthase [Streptococcus macacae]|nr:hydroxymethylglutaryl-CoA synthase [Streptococcus macacae]SUN78410.1 3-hydroxy-3-methylglutaryl-CoA synthase [Streptococcus macacae NCTC 11558]